MPISFDFEISEKFSRDGCYPPSVTLICIDDKETWYVSTNWWVIDPSFSVMEIAEVIKERASRQIPSSCKLIHCDSTSYKEFIRRRSDWLAAQEEDDGRDYGDEQ
jgi:hypothetical protein